MENIMSIYFKGYKVFSNKNYTKMEGISRVNIIIGKNNSGKTSLLDIIETVYDTKAVSHVQSGGTDINFSLPLDRKIVDSIFAGYSSIGGWNASSFYETYSGQDISLKISGQEKLNLSENHVIKDLLSYIPRGISELENRRRQYRFRKVSAERSIYPEEEQEIFLESTGEGASNLIRVFLNDSMYDEKVIEKNLLEALNKIMMPEAEFGPVSRFSTK